MLAILIYVIAALAVIAIGLVAVGREAFIASHEIRPAVFEVTEAVEFVADGLDDRTAGRLTPDDVRWILLADADLIESTGEVEGVQVGVLDDESAIAAVMERLDASRREVIVEADVAAVLDGRNRYLEAIGAVGGVAEPATGSDRESDRSGLGSRS